jgi:hypothetical protein
VPPQHEAKDHMNNLPPISERRKPDVPPTRVPHPHCPLIAEMEALRAEIAALLADRALLLDEIAAALDRIELLENVVADGWVRTVEGIPE